MSSNNLWKNRKDIESLYDEGLTVWLEYYEKNNDVMVSGIKEGQNTHWTIPDGNVNDYIDIIERKGGFVVFNGESQKSWEKEYPGNDEWCILSSY